MKRLLFVLLLCSCGKLYAQEAQVVLGPAQIAENQSWTITVTVNNGDIRNYGSFPDIKGFRKRGTSSQSQTSIINGRISSSHSVVMTYTPVAQGVVTVPPFSIKVNDLTVSSKGMKVKIGAPVKRQDPFSRFFGDDPHDRRGNEAREFVDVKADAQLALTTSRNEVFVGQGFTVTLSFLIANSNQAPMQFYQLGKQLTDILKKLRPTNCWEENANIESVEGKPITVGNRKFTQYTIYQGTFYPLNTDAVELPPLGLEMIKYKVAKNPSFFGPNRKEDFKTFYSRRKRIRVKELPPHPLKDVVSVGRYRLKEKVPNEDFQTGQSINYSFNVLGEGNISAITKPDVPSDENFDVYGPNINQTISRSNGRVTGTKNFSYYLVPKEPGTFPLSDYFQWVYFDPYRARYDTLVATASLVVSGDSFQNNTIQNADAGSFYDRIENADNDLRAMDSGAWVHNSIPYFVLLVLGTAAFFFFKK